MLCILHVHLARARPESPLHGETPTDARRGRGSDVERGYSARAAPRRIRLEEKRLFGSRRAV